MIPVAAFQLMPITYSPFIHDVLAQRVAIVIISVVHLAFGAGFILRSRSLWAAFFVYAAAATCIGVIGSIFDPPQGFDPIEGAIAGVFGLLVNGAFVVGLYFATRPAFDQPGRISG